MNTSLLFVRAKSRLGLLNSPKGEMHRNVGVEEGPDYVLSSEFLSQFDQKKEITYAFSSPESVRTESYYQKLANEYKTLISLITDQLTSKDLLVTIGGDHSVSFASLGSILQVHIPQSTGLIMIDSHADLHTSLTTETGNFHGMWLRALCDTFPVDSIDQLVPEKIPVQNMLYVGNLDTELAEQEYIHNNNISVFASNQLESSQFDKQIDFYLNTMSHIHVSIDIDGFSHQYAPATGMRIKNGLIPNTVIPLLQKLKNHVSLSVDLVEVNPTLPGAGKTVKLAQQLLQEILL